MRRLLAVVGLLALLLSGCVPTPFDASTGAGYDELIAGFEALSDAEQLASIAEHDLASQRILWAESGLDDALGGAEAADEVFAGLYGLVENEVEAVAPDGSTFVLASATQNVAEAHGAGMFAGMLVGSLLTDAGLAATKDGATGNASHDFGTGTSISIDAGTDGVTTTTVDMATTYKGVQIQIHVATEVNPCPDADGWVEPKGVYQVVIEGPNGTGNVTQVEVAMEILVNDEAEIAMSDYGFRTTYVNKPKPTDGGIFDVTSGAVDYEKTVDGEFITHEQKGFTDQAFIDQAVVTGAFLSQWVASSLEKSVEAGWKDGRCIDLTATPSAGPKGLDPGEQVGVLATPVAQADGSPAGGTVTATLTSGGAAVAPGDKVPADASFTYTAPPKENESGTVRFESRSKRGVGIREITFDSAAQHFAISGGSGIFAGSGEWCSSASAFSVSGGTVTTVLYLDGPDGGTVQYTGANSSTGWAGGGSFTVAYQDGAPVTITVAYSGTQYSAAGTSAHSAGATFTLTPNTSCDAQ